MDLKGVIPANYTGPRLESSTRVINKHLLPIGQKPIILIEKLTSIGVERH